MAFDFSAVIAPFRMQPGLRRIAPGAAQLTPTRPASRHLREKLAVLAHRADEALLAAPGFDAAPALAAPSPHEAAAEHPTPSRSTTATGRLSSRRGSAGRWRAGRLEGDGRADDRRAARRPARGVAAGSACSASPSRKTSPSSTARARRIPWLAVCLPSSWAPEEKVGRHFAEVHAPVADNAVAARGRATTLARLVTGGERWERFVWTITADPRLAPASTAHRGAALARRGDAGSAGRDGATAQRAPDVHAGAGRAAGGLHDPGRQSSRSATRSLARGRRAVCTPRSRA